MDGLRYCKSCRGRIEHARDFNARHYNPPPAFMSATRGDLHREDGEIKDAGSYLFVGPPGRGKTHLCWAVLKSRAQDPRVTIAAYSWPDVLSELKRGYGRDAGHPDKDKGYRLLDALREADVALIDDLAAEKITESNSSWIQGELFVVLNARWEWMRQTLLTSNLPPVRGIKKWPESNTGMLLSDYMGERISSRVGQMCQCVPLTGPDRRGGAR